MIRDSNDNIVSRFHTYHYPPGIISRSLFEFRNQGPSRLNVESVWPYTRVKGYRYHISIRYRYTVYVYRLWDTAIHDDDDDCDDQGTSDKVVLEALPVV